MPILDPSKFKLPTKKYKILMLSDHQLSPSGVGTQSRVLIEGLLRTGKYQFKCLGGAIKHENYDVVQVSPDWIIKPVDNFGTREELRVLLATEKPDALFLFTDPRQFIWVWQMEEEIHQICPIVFWHVWDNDPYPAFNNPWYDSTDLINCISYKTYELLKEYCPEKVNYVPHAFPKEMFYPMDSQEIKNIQEQSFGDKADWFKVLWVNRNAHRKMPADLMDAWKLFLERLEQKEGHRKALLLMHTDPNDPEGPNLLAVSEMFGLQQNVWFSTQKIDFQHMNILHNITDCTINIACLPAGELVATQQGYKPIDEIVVGEKVLTHLGKFQPVTKVFQRILNKESMFTIKTNNNIPINITGEHPVLTIKKEKTHFSLNENLEKFSSLADFCKVKELAVGDYVVYNSVLVSKTEENQVIDLYDLVKDETYIIRSKTKFRFQVKEDKIFCHGQEVCSRYLPLTEDLAYILGNWVANGSTNLTRISFNPKDIKKINTLVQRINKAFPYMKCVAKQCGKCVDVFFKGNGSYSVYIEMFHKLCGKYSADKHIPTTVMEATNNIKKAFLEGYIAGDGCIITNNYGTKYTRCRTISNPLAFGLKTLLVDLGYCPNMTYLTNTGYSPTKIWTVQWTKRKNKQANGSCRTWNVGNKVISRIYEIQEHKDQDCVVYNLEVTDDHTYTTQGFTVHNCNEGFGLTTLASMQVGKPAIALATGGETRQVIDHRDGSENGVAIKPCKRRMVGSQLVPYIYEDFASQEDVSNALMKIYYQTPEEKEKMKIKVIDYVDSEFPYFKMVFDWDKTMTKCIEGFKKSKPKSWSLTEIKTMVEPKKLQEAENNMIVSKVYEQSVTKGIKRSK